MNLYFTKEIKESDILKAIELYYGYNKKQLSEKDKRNQILEARQMAIYLLKEICCLSYPKIGEIFSRHHTSIMNSHQKMFDMIQIYDDFALKMHTIVAYIVCSKS